MKTRTLALAALIGLLIGFGVGQWATEQIEKKGSEELTSQIKSEQASIMIDYGNGKIDVYTDVIQEEHETLFEFTKNIAKKNNIAFEYKEYAGLGVLIEKVGTEKNGTEEKYWQYWVNNEYAQVGADVYEVQGDDIIEWKFVNLQGF